MGGLISRQSRIIFPARVVLALASALAFAGPAGASTLITGATVYDGSGAAGQKVSVRVDGDRIVAVGDLPATADTVIRGDGLALAPASSTATAITTGAIMPIGRCRCCWRKA
jgi:N-acyl-D-amino-acid deacylase